MLFSQTEIQMGDVKYGHPVQAQVVVTNNTNAPINIRVINSSCSCTSGSLRDTPVPANSDSILFINVDSKRAGIGSVMKSITIAWEEDRKPFSQTFLIGMHVFY